MYVNLSKKFITKNLLPHLSQSNLGRKHKVPLWRIIKAIIYRLKSGCQWREIPISAFCSRVLITWNSIYYHFRKWSKDGSCKVLWTKLLDIYKSKLDMSSIQLDGSHTPAKRGGEAVAYQNRKKSKTTNALFLTDKRGIPLAMSEPIDGNHNDLFDIENFFTKMLEDIEQSQIQTNGLFLNADAGFDSEGFRNTCFSKGIIANIDFNKRNSKNTDNQPLLDDLLYKERFSVERTNAWIDAFKTLLVRFETKAQTWMSLHYLAFSLILIRNQTNHF
jgi:transposase